MPANGTKPASFRARLRQGCEIGLLGLGFPEEYGGVIADQFMKIVARRNWRRPAPAEFRQPDEPHHGSPPIAPPRGRS